MDMKKTEKTSNEAFAKKFWMNEMNADEQREKYDRMQEQLRLMRELAEGRKSGEEEGWIPSEDVREHFRVRANVK